MFLCLLDVQSNIYIKCKILRRYVRHLDMTVHSIHIKTKLCQLVEAMMMRRDDLAFRQEMKFRNKLVEYLTDWVMGTSHQIAPPSSGDVTCITRLEFPLRNPRLLCLVPFGDANLFCYCAKDRP